MLNGSSETACLNVIENMLTGSIDVRLNEAERLYNNCKFKECYQIVSELVSLFFINSLTY